MVSGATRGCIEIRTHQKARVGFELTEDLRQLSKCAKVRDKANPTLASTDRRDDTDEQIKWRIPKTGSSSSPDINAAISGSSYTDIWNIFIIATKMPRGVQNHAPPSLPQYYRRIIPARMELIQDRITIPDGMHECHLDAHIRSASSQMNGYILFYAFQSRIIRRTCTTSGRLTRLIAAYWKLLTPAEQQLWKALSPTERIPSKMFSCTVDSTTSSRRISIPAEAEETLISGMTSSPHVSKFMPHLTSREINKSLASMTPG
ncbi:15221_t:CDS:2, partial [Acaulospora colombiana]